MHVPVRTLARRGWNAGTSGKRCLGGRKVNVFEVKRGRDPKVASGVSSATGGYVAKESKADGRYYAEVGETAIPGLGTCLSGKSRSIKLG